MANTINLPSQQYLKLIFDYVDGWLVFKYTGKVAGNIKERYVKINIEGDSFYAHRLIWCWHYGYYPEYIDHINGNGFNNKIENLRECNQSQNSGNANWGDMRGIEQRGGSFRVRLKINGQRVSYGSYQALAEAIKVRNEAYRKVFGEFSFFG
jgi:hypothetical protein